MALAAGDTKTPPPLLLVLRLGEEEALPVDPLGEEPGFEKWIVRFGAEDMIFCLFAVSLHETKGDKVVCCHDHEHIHR